MTKGIRISARISRTTRDRLDAYARRTGVTKSRFVEQALLHHLQAGDEIVDSMESATATKALIDLMHDGD